MINALIFSALSPSLRADVLPINSFGGLDTDNSPLLTKEGMTPDAENVNTDEIFGLSPRKGFVSFSTEVSAGLWVFPLSNGSQYIITASSGTLKATLSGNNFTAILSTYDTSARISATSLGDKFYWSSSDGLKHWDTSVVTVDSVALNFTLLVTWKGRLAGAGKSGDTRTVYLSEYLNGSNFQLAVNPVETDPARIQVQGNVDENLTTLFSSFKDKLVWAKANSFGALVGSRRSQFSSEVYSDNVGSAYPESFRDCDGLLRFLGSNRTVWEYDGATLKPISRDIDNQMALVTQGDANSRSFTQSSQADWQNGVSNPTVALDTAIVPGDVTFKPQSTVTTPTDTFNDNDYTSSPAWTVAQGSFGVVSGALVTLNGNPHSVISAESNFSTGTFEWEGTNLKNTAGFQHQYNFMSSDPSVGKNGYAFIIGDGNPGQGSLSFVKTLNDGSFDTLITSRGWTPPLKKIRVTRKDTGVFQSSFAASNDVYVAMVDTVDARTSYSNYFVMEWNHSDDAGADQMNVNNVIVGSVTYILNSTFTSQTYNMGNKATSWGVFTADSVLDPGTTITYGIYAGSGTAINVGDPSTFVTSQTIMSGQVPTIPISSYVTVAAFFSRSTFTSNASLNDFTVSWIDGSKLLAPSLYYFQRYWLSVAVSSNSNNVILVYDRNEKWQRWRGMNMNAAVIANGNPYFGNGVGIFQADSGNTDNGKSIAAYFRTKRYVPSGLDYQSYFNDLYMTTNNSADTLSVQYYVDGVNTPYTLANYVMNTKSGNQDIRLPFHPTDLQQGKMIDLLFTVNGMTQWNILEANLYFTKEPVPIGN